ncbi:MAG: hypothetical protein Q7S27_07070 [Nanoarchaeota archaeon]|nr:hypothetical protein [Nanoarchaeota archaeon]
MTGVLPIALSRACRLNEYFMHKDKVYVGIMRLHKDVTDSDLKKAMKSQTGKITQLPPLRSSVKRAERIREVKKFDIIEIAGKDVLFLAEVQAGTYIRRICDEVGKELGGAHMLELRRTRASIFEESTSVNLYQFEKALEEYKNGNEILLKSILIPAESCILKVMPKVNIKESSIKQLLTGKPLMKTDIIEKLPLEDIFAVFHESKFLAIMKKSEEKDILARPEFVLN